MQSVVIRSGDVLRRYGALFKAAAIIIALFAFFLIIRSFPLERTFHWIRDQVAEMGPWAPAVFIMLFVVLTTLLLPGWPLNVASGAIFGAFWGGVLTSLGSTAAAAVSFLIARYLARKKVADMIEHFPKLCLVYHSLGKDQGWKVVAAVRLSHSLPFGLQNFLLGVSPVRFLPYLLTTWLVTLPGIFIIAYLGYLGGMALDSEDPQETASTWTWVARGVGVLIAASAVYYLGRTVYRAVKSSQAEIQESGACRGDKKETKDSVPWITVAALVGSLLLLGLAVVCYLQRDRIRELVEGAQADHDPPSLCWDRRLPDSTHRVDS